MLKIEKYHNIIKTLSEIANSDHCRIAYYKYYESDNKFFVDFVRDYKRVATVLIEWNSSTNKYEILKILRIA